MGFVPRPAGVRGSCIRHHRRFHLAGWLLVGRGLAVMAFSSGCPSVLGPPGPGVMRHGNPRTLRRAAFAVKLPSKPVAIINDCCCFAEAGTSLPLLRIFLLRSAIRSAAPIGLPPQPIVDEARLHTGCACMRARARRSRWRRASWSGFVTAQATIHIERRSVLRTVVTRCCVRRACPGVEYRSTRCVEIFVIVMEAVEAKSAAISRKLRPGEASCRPTWC